MSLAVRASVVVVAVCLLCGVWASGSVDLPPGCGCPDAVTAVVHADLEGPGDSTTLGEQADPEDADAMSTARGVQSIAATGHVPRISAERTRSIRPDRPPRLVHLG